MTDKLTTIFKIISFYDDFRWKSSHNDILINFFKKGLNSDIKILTHWLCYITDRQMPFQRIWDIGGFVFSELIFEIKRQKSLELLNPDNEISFVKNDTNDKFTFISKAKVTNNSILAKYQGIFDNGKVTFKSRFFPSDYLSILYTFVVLEDYDFSFSKFIKEVYCRHKDDNDVIKRILFSLYLLSYYDIGQPNSSLLCHFSDNLNRANERKIRIKDILNDPDIFRGEYNNFLKDKVFNQKRAWCSLRDFLKSPEFVDYFEMALRAESLTDSDFTKLFSLDSLTQLELPGDVWNNNSQFRYCILKGTVYETSKMALNKILREYYNNNYHDIIGYPEQFDVTFDFVPRMCESNNCDLCPIYRVNEGANHFNRICLDDENMYCPVVLTGCNYKHHCKGRKNCKIV